MNWQTELSNNTTRSSLPFSKQNEISSFLNKNKKVPKKKVPGEGNILGVCYPPHTVKKQCTIKATQAQYIGNKGN